jgi:carboxylate-amine ligase
MENAEQCIRFHNFFMHFMPHLIALSASAPFEDGVETGLATIRPSITESMPITGMPYNFKNWQDYVNLCRAMFRAGSIENLKDSWWDYRPSPKYGTLEIRICDMPATLGEAMAITAFIHGIAMWFSEHQTWLDEMPRPNLWRIRENKWRAMRYGTEAQLVLNNQGDTRPLREDIENWLERIAPFVQKNNYSKYIGTLRNILERGNSSQRQQKVWKATHDLTTVARFNCDEFAAQKPLWDKADSYAEQATDAKKPDKAVESTDKVVELPISKAS